MDFHRRPERPQHIDKRIGHDDYFGDSMRSAYDDSPSMVVEYYKTVARHRQLIAVLAIAFAGVGYLIHLATQSVYQTRTSIAIQSINGDFMNAKSVDPTLAASADTIVQTQVKLLQSDSLLDRVATRLTSEPHPSFVLRNDPFSRIKRSLHLGTSQKISYEDLLTETSKGLKIKPLGVTQLIEITCDSWDPAFAARFCNTLISEFQAVDLESRGDQAKRTSDWLVRQAEDVRQKAEVSQQKLIAATGGNGLMLSEKQNGVGEEGLREMQSELVRAQANRMEKEAQIATQQSAPSDGLPIKETAAYAANKVRLADLQNQIAALIPPLTEANPRIIHLRAEIHQVEQNLRQESQYDDARLRAEYVAAERRERLLSLAYHSQEGRVSSDLQKSSDVDLLRREVQSEQQLYQTLLQRAKEAGFASAMPASTIRIVDAAKKPRLAIYPRRLSTMIIGFLLGTFAGVIAAFFKERNRVLLRLPGDSERYVQTEELGVIPSAATMRKFALAEDNTSTAAWTRPGLLSAKTDKSFDPLPWNSSLSLTAEAYRNTTLSIMLSVRDRKERIFVVSSPSAGEGKTTITTNLGVALSKSKLKVVLIDGDLRKPSLHRMLAVSNEVGLRQVLRHGVDGEGLSIKEICSPTAFENLFVIPSGANSSRDSMIEMLHSAEFGKLLQALAEEYDVVLVDTPPILHMADARILAGQTRGTILVFRSGITSREDAITARLLLDRDRVHVVGCILNDFNPKSSGKSGYYNSYSSYYQQSQDAEETAVSS